MKFLKLYMTGIASLFILALLAVSCTKSFDRKVPSDSELGTSSIAQVYIATVNATRNVVYMDGKPISSAVTSPLLVTGNVFPGAYGFKVPGGLHNITVRDTLRTSTQQPLNFPVNFDLTKNYTIFTYDTITVPKVKIVQTNIEIPADTTARLRFANFIYAPNALPALDIYSYVRQENIFTNVAVTGVTDFIPFRSTGFTDSLFFRETGTTNVVFKMALGTLTPKRSYTLVYRGSHNPLTTSPKGTTLFANY